MNDESRRPIAVEDLIRLKRAERPPAEFWAQFDRELRAKQLAALVEKRAWWHQVPLALAGLVRHRLPLGATAILAVAILGVRDYETGPANGPGVGAVPAVPVASIAGSVSGGAGTGSTILATISEEAPGVYGTFEVRDSEVTMPGAAVANSEVAPSVGSSSSSFLLGTHSHARVAELMPSGRLVGANLAVAQAADPMMTRSLLGSAYGYEARMLPVRSATVEPLAQMATPSEARRARLQSAMAMMSSSVAPVRTGERAASQISDDRLYDQTHRLSGRGDRMSFKF